MTKPAKTPAIFHSLFTHFISHLTPFHTFTKSRLRTIYHQRDKTYLLVEPCLKLDSLREICSSL